MKKLMLFISATILLSCNQDQQEAAHFVSTIQLDGQNVNVKIIEYEGCEYLYIQTSYAGIMSHKGNCKNPIHIYAKK